jgi:hypothetical protein
MTGASGYGILRIKARRLAKFLIAYPEQGATREQLARQCSLPGVSYSPASITNMWPLVESYVKALSGLYANRPIAQTGYLCFASSQPWVAALVQVQREKNVVTRLVNDVEQGAALGQLIDHAPRDIAIAMALRKARGETYLASQRSQAQDLDAAERQMIGHITAIARIPATARP